MIQRLRPLFPYMKKYRGTLAIGAVCVVLNNGIWILFAQVLARAINDLNRALTGNKLATYSLLLLAIAGTKGIFQFLTRWLLIGVSREIEFDLRNDLFRHLEGLSYTYYQRTRTGDVMARATNDLNAVRMLLGPAIMYSANTIAFMSGALFFMLHISPKLTLYAFAPLPVASVVIQYFGRKIHQRFERIQAMFSDITARVQENLSGVRVIRAFVQEPSEISRFEVDNEEYIKRSLHLVRIRGLLWPLLELMLALAIILVLWLGGREVLEHRIDLGKFVAFNIYMVQLTWPIIALGWVVDVFQRGTASMERIQQIFAEKPEITDADVPTDAPTEVVGEIEFRDLSFRYPPRAEDLEANSEPPLVLRNVNLKIPAGTSLAIVGPTGSGKSTLVNLIPRIYDAAPGSVLIDGRPVREFLVEVLRKNVGFVPQETFLFSDTIRENIAFGAPHALDVEVRTSADAASIATEIEEFPEQFKTMVGERGITLSGGQKQRTAIARALVRNPKILVLDDALASVDTQTEDRILNHLRRLMEGRTTVFISHRVSTVRNADQIAVLEHGEIVELGSHDELIAKNGYYTELYNKQLLEEELETV
ncbi:MAG TPA: ABC transporter ATP-binding protein [Candidatus Koribacter sp.]